MGRIRRDVEDTVDTFLFQRVGVILWIAAKAATTAAAAAIEFPAAVANEYQFNLLLETGRVVDVIQGD